MSLTNSASSLQAFSLSPPRVGPLICQDYSGPKRHWLIRAALIGSFVVGRVVPPGRDSAGPVGMAIPFEDLPGRSQDVGRVVG